MVGFVFNNIDNTQFEIGAFSNVRVIGTFDTTAPTGSSTSPRATLTQSIDLRTLLPSSFTFDNTQHRFYITPLVNRTFDRSAGAYDYDARWTVISADFDVRLRQSGNLEAETVYIPFPEFSIAPDGYSLSIISESINYPAFDVSQGANICVAFQDIVTSAQNDPNIENVINNGCSRDLTSNDDNLYEGGSYLVIMADAA